MKSFITRILSLCSIFILYFFAPKNFHVYVFAFGFSHYILSLVFSYKLLRTSVSHRKGLLGTIILLSTAAAVFYVSPIAAFIIAFGAHVALSETYDEPLAQNFPPAYLFTRFLFYFSCFLAISYRDFNYLQAFSSYVAPLVVIFFVGGWISLRGYKTQWRHVLPSDLLILTVTLFYLGSNHIYRAALLAGLYHYFYWLYSPIVFKPARKSCYLFLSNLTLSLVLVWSLFDATYAQGPVSFIKMNLYYGLAAYLHAFLTIIGSRQNPMFLRAYFFSSKERLS